MIKKILAFSVTLYLFLSSVGCAEGHTESISIQSNNSFTDPILVPYKDKFIKTAKESYGIVLDDTNLSMKFGAVDSDQTIAVCELYYTQEYQESNITRREIVVNEAFWGNDEALKDNFMTHELGHCLLFRGHVTEKIMIDSTEAPSSIMHPNPITMMTGLGPEFYYNHINYYLNELFEVQYYGSIFAASPSMALKTTYKINTTGCDHKTEEQ